MTLRPINNKQKREKFASLFLDEIKLALLATITRMWVKIGTQAEIITDDNHEKCYGYTAIDSVSCKTHYRMAKDFNGREFLLFIEQLKRQYSDETVVIVMDNAPAHGYRKIHGEVKVNERLYFYFLPPYTAAKLNPVEKVFRFFRSKVTHNLSLVNTENLATTEFDPQLAVVFDIRCRSTKGNEKSPNVSQDRVNWTSTMADRILPVGNGGVLGSSKSMSKMRVNPYRDRAKSFYQRYVMKGRD